MIKDFKNTFQQTAIYGIGNVLVKATGLALLPIYLGALSTSEYGALVMFEVITQFMVGVFSFRFQSSLLRFGSEAKSPREQGSVYFTATLMMLGASIFVCAAFTPLSGLFSDIVFDSREYAYIFPLLLASVALEMMVLMPLQLLRLREKPLAYIGFLAFKLGAMLALVSYFVMLKEQGVYGAILGIFLANALTLLATLPLQWRHVVFMFDKPLAGSMFRYGAPLIFTSISAILLSIADRLIINHYGELSDVGVYGLAYKIGSVVNLLVINSFSLGFLPIAFKKFGQVGFERFFTRTLTYFTVITVIFTLGISLFSKELIKLLSSDTPDYWAALILVPFIAFSFIFKAIQYYFSLVFHLTKRTRYDALVTMLGFSFNLGLNLAWVPAYGIYGAVAATGLSYVFMGILTLRYAQAQLRVQYEWKRLAILIISSAVAIALGLLANDWPIALRLSGKGAVLLLYGLFLYVAFADKAEKDKLRKLRLALSEKGGLQKVIQAAISPGS